MKILQIIPAFPLAGAETMCVNLCIALKQLGHQVTAVSLYHQETALTRRLEEAGVPLLDLDKRPGLDLSMFPKLIRLFRAERPDVVHSHLYAAQYVHPAAVLCGVRARFHTVHSLAREDQTGAGRALCRVLFHHFHVVPVALSREIRKTILSVYRLRPGQSPVILNGIDLSACLPKDAYAAPEPLRLLHIGRFVPLKNHALMLRTLAELQPLYPGLRMQFIGGGELEPDIKALARSLGLEEQVSFPGLQGNVYPFLHEADVFLLPSAYEGVPMSLIEAMGTGLPIVAGAVGGIPDMLEDEVSALLIPPEQDALAAALKRLCSDAALRARLGREALRRAEDFSARTMAEQYAAEYRNAL